MKIGIVSDSHGSYSHLDLMLSHKDAEQAELWLFAGDIAMDADYLAMVTDIRLKVPPYMEAEDTI